MRRILLLLEDYNEQVFMETLLKKIGFDVLSARNESALADQMLIFKPDVLVSTGDGNKIKGTNVAKRLANNKTNVKLVLLFPLNKLQDQKLMAQFNADVAVETPVNPKVLISTICDVTQLDTEAVMKKFEKLPIAKGMDLSGKSDGIKIVSGKAEEKVPVTSVTDRKSRYAQILAESENPPDKGFTKAVVTEETKKLLAFEKDNPDVKRIDEERKKFVVGLYRKS